MQVILRTGRLSHFARIRDVSPSRGELFYLRALLQLRPANSFSDLRTVNGIERQSFQDAATAIGLFEHETEANYVLTESITTLKTPNQLRHLFVDLLVNDCILTPLLCWNTFRGNLSRDFNMRHPNMPYLAFDSTLENIGHRLEEYGRRLSDYQLPEPIIYGRELEHEMGRWAAQSLQLARRSDDAFQKFNEEQRHVFNEIIFAVTNHRPLLIFLDGKAGVGKTFLINAVCDKLRSENIIALLTATSAFAAQLYRGGRTTHSTFKVCLFPQLHYRHRLTHKYDKQIPVNDNSQLLSSPIQKNDTRGDLINHAGLITFDEVSMLNRAAFACAEEVCRRVMNNDVPFGEKPVVLLGDFRQTCPVVPGGSQLQIIDACIQTSPLWSKFEIRRLTQLIRNAQDPGYAEFVNAIGDGAGPVINLDMLSITTDKEEIINFVFPASVLLDPSTCLTRGILAPTNKQVDEYNSIILDRVHGQTKLYYASDSLKEASDIGLDSECSILDYVARRSPYGLPPHCLVIKTNAVYRLLRNFSIDRQLVKNVRVVVTEIGRRIITVKPLRDRDMQTNENEEDIILPRITFSHILSSGHTLLRRQFPLAPAYSTTFHSCQGQTFDKIGIDLTKPVFTHGQLYTALSRVRHREDVKIRLCPNQKTTTNITFHDILLPSV